MSDYLDNNDRLVEAMEKLTPEEIEREREAWFIASGQAWGVDRDNFDNEMDYVVEVTKRIVNSAHDEDDITINRHCLFALGMISSSPSTTTK